MSELPSQPRSPNRFSRWVIRVLNPARYHSMRAQERWQNLFRAEVTRWLKAISGTRPLSELELETLMSWLDSRLPNLEPLLSGTIQPADFVKHWVEIAEQPPDVGEGRLVERMREKLEEDPDRTKRWLFGLALDRADLNMEGTQRAVDDRSAIRVGFLMGVNLLVLAILLWFGLSLDMNLLTAMSNLEFASVLLIAPIMSLFASSQLIRSHHLRKSYTLSQQTRLSAAMHAYKTYQDVQDISQARYGQVKLDMRMLQAKGVARENALIARERLRRVDRLMRLLMDEGSELPEAVQLEIARFVLAFQEIDNQASTVPHSSSQSVSGDVDTMSNRPASGPAEGPED